MINQLRDMILNPESPMAAPAEDGLDGGDTLAADLPETTEVEDTLMGTGGDDVEALGVDPDVLAADDELGRIDRAA